ncbi:MAG: hypothetical protein OXU20_04175 [Myxococcales bacterium]|nr:hypothetical protein [Myxococcales bacterium]MDD9972167.1 hypothetical protein [Myxococcales bacterium]
MKPAGKAIDMAVVGLGQAGGNLAAEMQRRGYRALALNTASSDLSSLSATSGLSLPAEQRLYIGIDGYDGAGSDLNYGRECITSHADAIRERVEEHAQTADVVLIATGLGGGTGSAVAELINVLEPLGLPIIALATLPNQHESGIAKVNAVKAVNALVKESLLGWIFVDNSRLSQNHGDVPLDRYYTEINKLIVEPLDALNGLNDREHVTPIRSFDGEDFRSLLLSGGILNLADTDVPRLDVDSIMQGVREAVQYSPIMPEGFALEQVAYLGLVIEASEATLEGTPFSVFEQISEHLKDETSGAATYLGIYKNAQASDVRLRLICSTQSLPDGMQEMVNSAKREGGQLRDKLQQTMSGLDLGEIEEYELFRTSPGVIRRRITEPPAASSGASRSLRIPAAPAAPSIREPVRESVRPEASIPAPKAATVADREAYDQLIKEYRESEDDDVKQRVSERLQTDGKSDNSLIRYYAVRAMSKIDPEMFAASLKAATQDEDATVRAVATKALQQA